MLPTVQGTFYATHVEHFSLLSNRLIVVITSFLENFQLISVDFLVYSKPDRKSVALETVSGAQFCGVTTLRRNLDGVSQHCLINNCNLVEQFHRKLKLIILEKVCGIKLWFGNYLMILKIHG